MNNFINKKKNFIRNACFLKTEEIAKMKYIGEEFIKDVISGLNIKINKNDSDEGDKMAFIKFCEKNRKDNLDCCLEFNEGLKNIILYVYKNIKTINTRKGIYNNTFEGGRFPYEICKDLKSFLEDNKNMIFNLSKKILFLIIIEKKRGEFKEKLNEKTKEKIDEYYKNKLGQLIIEDKASATIISFILNDLMNQRNDQTKNRLYKMNDNLFDIFSNKFLWEESIYKNDKFIREIEKYIKLGISVKTSYDFYKYIVNNNFKEFEEEIKGILEKINNEEKAKLVEIKREERIKKEKELEKLTIGTNTDDVKVLEDNDDDFGDY